MKVPYFILFGLFALIVIPLNAYAQETVSSYSLDGTTIIEIQNNSDEDIYSVRMWGGEGFNFETFKTERGWFGDLNAAGVLIFKSPAPIKSGESVKFGVKTNISNPGINWKTLDNDENQIEAGKVLASQMPDFVKTSKQPVQVPDGNPVSTIGINSDSTFRTVPDKPNVGSLFRLTGDSFGASQEFDFYIDSTKIGSFVTDKNGHFITTMKVPEDQKEGRIDLKIKDKENNETTQSIRIKQGQKIVSVRDIVPLTVKGIPEIAHRGDFVDVHGTGTPTGAITSTIVAVNGEGDVFSSKIAEIDNKGDWKLTKPIPIPLDMPFGVYEILITDGREEIKKRMTIESDKVIVISPFTTKYELGETMIFNGTALPNIPLEIIIENPLGSEVFSDIIQMDKTGDVSFEYKIDFADKKGTYTVIATQEKEKEFIFVGVGQLPTIPVLIEFDKLNYKSSETANIILVGKSSEIIKMLILNPSDQPKEEAISITLGPDGTADYQLNLSGYSSGVYTAVISKGSSQSTESFSVGLLTGSGDISVKTTKMEYLPSDSIVIIGQTDPNVLLSISLVDPDGKTVKEKDTFSSKEGVISESSFKFPSDAQPGIWEVYARSGSNFYSHTVDIIPSLAEGLIVTIEEGMRIDGIGDTIQIRVQGAQSTLEFEIQSADGKVLETFTSNPSKTGELSQPWIIPKGTPVGTYTLIIYDMNNSIETDFEIQ